MFPPTQLRLIIQASTQPEGLSNTLFMFPAPLPSPCLQSELLISETTHNGFVRNAEKSFFFFFAILIGVMKMNAESLTLRMPRAFAACIIHTFCRSRKRTGFGFGCIDCHVFSFTAIKSSACDYANESKAGNLIKPQI